MPKTSIATSVASLPPPVFDFRRASIRHFKDAEFLNTNGRSPNAGHLYGFSAECGIKAFLIGMGHPTESDGDMRASALRGHIHKLQSLFH